ncbi:minor tail protein [Mycobacterium phage MrMagoo]|uniref:Minor tail protein n=1 Tax=Mycobacterium phage MrMagoo TaxID=1927020 RepID=A0A1L6BYG9_9CAUD|nr:minor tail protein [Mycobacterium phage MrMagoo]APQ42144.1 minor tail protein [Mycobacterium phage MrMagoo]ARM70219.1 hypothetical protein SEA_GARDENSALSA_39 [Mycobacterium phage GardenSalsa]
MGSFKPLVPVRSNRPLELQRGNPLRYRYTLAGNREFPLGTTALLTVANTYGQTVGAYVGVVGGKYIDFAEAADISDTLARTDSWQLFVTYPSETMPTLLEQGQVIRIEAPYPDAPPQSSEFDGVAYEYHFGTPGLLTDPAWRIMNGHPRVYDNSLRSLPNAVAAGTLLTGLTPWDDVAMLWFAPLQTDAVRLTYNTIRAHDNSNGEMWTVICSNYDMSNWAGFHHKQVFGIGSWDSDTISVVTGTGPTTFVNRVSASKDTQDNQIYTAEFNPITDTFTLYVGTDMTPVVSWTDTTSVVDHGPGERYVGFGFKSTILDAGVQVSDWIIADTP